MTEEQTLKTCKICNELVTLDKMNGKRCKKCVYKQNTERNKEYMKEYYKQNKYEQNGDDALPAVYKIKCKDSTINDFYIGSTKHLKRREKEHSIVCNGGRNKKPLYEYIRNNGGWENWELVIVETVLKPEELFSYEKKHIMTLKPTLNINGGTIRKEY